ncbi:LOW QUALITY PROTEIN: WASH complex subunit 3 [Leptopilina boulardi]|uniref:LOW QUALITY PROTEIN: WASH complex subunit 3 n=1 Tax=Leptopilina boulardi TaxID=63433 RepID=UPI0021F632EB|nr:LOW QUALITY PROTEIN: WASH complex subunit 3 [Leptopilina boulardi]
MAEYNIPIIEPTIDYTKVPPINQKRTITFINHFVAHTVTFLNKFTLTCEEKLFEFENKLQRVQASLEILESRLSSVPGLVDKTQTAEEIQKQEVVNQKDTPHNQVSEEKENPIKPPTLSVDKVLKMLQVGIPKPAVKIKMELEGLDSSVLE